MLGLNRNKPVTVRHHLRLRLRTNRQRRGLGGPGRRFDRRRKRLEALGRSGIRGACSALLSSGVETELALDDIATDARLISVLDPVSTSPRNLLTPDISELLVR